MGMPTLVNDRNTTALGAGVLPVSSVTWRVTTWLTVRLPAGAMGLGEYTILV